jgi:7,8-dihydroneopterin aldolase/epimerase/oxygenase
MTDHVRLTNLLFDGRHGVHEWEQQEAQPFEVDVDLVLDLQPAGTSDDLARTVDYGGVYDLVREIVEGRSFGLIEALAETIGKEVLAAFPPVDEVGVVVRKPAVQLGGPLDHAAVEIHRRR